MSSKIKNNKKVVKKVESDSDSESSEEVKKVVKPTKKVAKKVESSDSDSSSEVVQKKSKKTTNGNKKSKKAQEDSDDESSEEVKKVVSKRKESSQKGKKVAKKVQDSDDESASDSDSSSEVVQKNKKNGKQEVVEEEEEEGCKEIFVKNLPYTATEDSLYEHFGAHGTVVNVKVCKDKETGRSRGFGFIEFEKRSECKKAIASPSEIDGRGYLLAFSDQKDSLNGVRGPPGQGGDKAFGGGNRADAHTVFVGNLKYRISEHSIRQFFGSCGNIINVRIAKHEDGKEKGFGHVDFDTKEACDAAVLLAGGEIDGRECRVDHAEKRRNDGGSGGRGGGRGGFGGDRGGRGGGFRGGDRGGRGGFSDRGGRGGGRGGFRGGIDRPQHGQMGGSGARKTFNSNSDSD